VSPQPGGAPLLAHTPASMPPPTHWPSAEQVWPFEHVTVGEQSAVQIAAWQ